MFLIYNFMRTLAIIGKIIGGNNKVDSTLYSKIIDRIRNDLGKGKIMILEVKKNSEKSSQMYNSGFNYEDNNNNNSNINDED